MAEFLVLGRIPLDDSILPSDRFGHEDHLKEMPQSTASLQKQLWEFPKIPLEIIERHLLVFLGLADI